ncbi:hypothetical protein [uncultured Roseobacter sp.]|uniref:hypothetical protein n=1 Tax=uncultured Roseobacter sp. TaxID=114847 RepID=UPI0026267FF3|nr:hypothetical protein [uncultured Roseobacter sp.]
MAKSSDSPQIAGHLTVQDWLERKSALECHPTSELWQKTFEEFLEKRLRTRYLDPVEMLATSGKNDGEGFLIVSIQCALIEFLAALRSGKAYRHLSNGETLGPYEYASSIRLFVCFLSSERPFSDWFPSNRKAETFYKNIRCGLLHEARTKGGWRIKTSREACIDHENKIIDRDKLQNAINDYIHNYGKRLKEDPDLQVAFIRKFDHLCGP